ncbi:hypothetical protein RO3G_09525 [Rhizopus delemar RA 99-880]|uniref:Uncharacterized protein n=1 Tax=Rhizopus delemar (strain RA 99-880 / ATCC MYA-4621 / FGSC 9543 / NRRL 43880) TaxID=246409 RepID=I1C8N5_RHIO9|nr:hypothetical protein RO3G_09519 [Rhizopus delemar RA 99-880]EIE84815.1 hypothetical protein RO3G_09525 [Rhizopus delemar RA 99-880]|eukprot:EIE84809.1 hypothetical protein RO3G_09519 [Rhizopus delemar RA 99-880]
MVQTIQVLTLENHASSSGRAQSQGFQGHQKTISATKSRLPKTM